MISDLKNTVEQVQGAVPVTVFHLRGWLDAQSEEDFLKWAGEAYENGARYLLLDLSELDTLTSAGMRAIQKVFKMYNPEGTSKRVAAPENGQRAATSLSCAQDDRILADHSHVRICSIGHRHILSAAGLIEQ